jgi:hypothetical protein
MRRLILFLGLFLGGIGVIVGVVGMLSPVSVSPEQQIVKCGSAIAPDLSAARAEDDRSPANVPILGEVVADTNYTRLCHMELDDRRIGTISLAAFSATAIIATLVFGAFSRRRHRRDSRSTRG